MTDQAHPATTGQPLDLDEVQARAEAAAADRWCDTPFCSVAPEPHPRQPGCPGNETQWNYYRTMTPEVTLRLVAELRAALDVVEACHAAERYNYDDAGIFRINGALDRYDKRFGGGA